MPECLCCLALGKSMAAAAIVNLSSMLALQPLDCQVLESSKRSYRSKDLVR